MRKIYYLLLLLFSFSVLSAQEKLSKEEKARREKNIQAGNPFVKYGSKAPVATLSKGKYLEVHDLDSIVTIGTSRWHVDNKKIVGDIIVDSLNVDAQPIGDRVGRWMSPDPLSEEFPSWSPYNMCFNNPVQFVDPDGMAPYDWRINYVDKQGNNQEYIFNGGASALPDNQFVRDFVGAYNHNVANGGGQAMRAIAENSNIMVDVQQSNFMSIQEYPEYSGTTDYNIVNWNSKSGLETSNGSVLSPATILEHEADHALKYATDPNKFKSLARTSDSNYENKEEKRVITGSEQRTAIANNEIPMPAVTRTNHDGQPVITKSPTSNKVDRAKTYQFLKELNNQGIVFPGFSTDKYKN